MNDPVFLLRCLREQGTVVRAEHTTRVLGGKVQAWTAIVYRGRMPSPVQMACVSRYRERILQLLELDGCVSEPAEVEIPFDFEWGSWADVGR